MPELLSSNDFPRYYPSPVSSDAITNGRPTLSPPVTRCGRSITSHIHSAASATATSVHVRCPGVFGSDHDKGDPHRRG